MSGSITETYRRLEKEFAAQQAVLESHRQNPAQKREVEAIIADQQLMLKCSPSFSGNIWSNVENLEQNIERVKEEIKLYDYVSKGQTPPSRLRFR